MEAIKRYRQIFVNIFGADEDALGPGFTFEAVEGWDSMTHLELIGALEDAFGVLFAPEDVLHFGSYENGLRILRSYGAEI